MRIKDVGVLDADTKRSFAGYTLISPFRSRVCYLVGARGDVVHEWRTADPLLTVSMLPDGHLLTAQRSGEGPPSRSTAGLLREYDWDGDLVWSHVDHGQHHDLRRLDSGNTLYLGWEPMPEDRARLLGGGIPGTDHGTIYSDYVNEVAPDGRLVFQWHAYDLPVEKYPLSADCARTEFAHANSCCPLPDGGVLLSFRIIDTLMIVDRSGRVRWEKRDVRWGHQHHAERLPNGNILLFANGMTELVQPLSSRVIELDPATGETVWQYRAPQSWTFFSPIISSAQRLPNGNTLICEGVHGRVFEVTPSCDVVWEYVSPFFGDVFPANGPSNALYRAYRYAADSPEIDGRLPAPVTFFHLP